MSRLISAVVLLSVVVGTALAQTPSQAAQAAQSASVPQNCINAGAAIQGACNSELQAALKAGGISVNTNDVGALISAFQQAVRSGQAQSIVNNVNPSAGCCKAACDFTRQLCGCNQAVTNLVQGGLGVDSGTLGGLLTNIAGKCKFPAYFQATGNCPSTANFQC